MKIGAPCRKNIHSDVVFLQQCVLTFLPIPV